jgi:3-oxoadipate enol-lactonase
MHALEPHFQVVRYDIRGHGRTEATPGPYTPELLAKDAIALLDALGIDKVHWVGLSMGGMIGQAVVLNHPDRLESLALCDTTGAIPLEAQHLWQERIDAVREKGIGSQMEPTMTYFTSSFSIRSHVGTSKTIPGTPATDLSASKRSKLTSGSSLQDQIPL